MMTDTEQRTAAKAFAEHWKDRGYEKGESQPFWIELLQTVYGVENATHFITFEEQVHLDHTSFIDGMIPSTRVMIEQKGIGKDLNKPIKQSDGTYLTPFQQAKRYIVELPVDQHPRWVVTCNFAEFWVYDMNRPSGEPEIIKLEDLPKEYYRLQFLVDTGNDHLKREMEVSMAAGEIVGLLYDAFAKQYRDPTSKKAMHSLNVLCVRLVFCLYAEDAGIFGRHGMFHDYLAGSETRHMRRALTDLFKILDTPMKERDPYLAEDYPELAAFPYVNGGLFSDEDIEIPTFTDEIRDLLLEKASTGFDWSEISPTIFGAVFESTLNPETRRSGGMHYTSIENIHKVVDPLFLDDLKKEFAEIQAIPVVKTKERKLREFQKKLASSSYLDPACGSGNFLTESYLSLRRLENDVLRELSQGQISFGDENYNPIQVSIGQFYGIEINDFAVTVAKTALWIAESQMMKETESIVLMQLDFLPLKSYTNIVEGNALRMNWEDVVPKEKLNYIMGNPPFVGARNQNAIQKWDLVEVCTDVSGNEVKNSKFLDYVAGWYYKAGKYIQNSQIECAFVSTNSICQGEQVALLWKPLKEEYGITINFAYQTFVWNSEATNIAHVHCVIIGFSLKSRGKKVLYYSNGVAKQVEQINGYLLEAPDIYMKRLTCPLGDVPQMSNGNRAYDGNNLVMTKEEKEELVKKEPLAEKYIRRYYMGVDLLKGEPRYVLWLVNVEPSDINKMPEVKKRIEKVRIMRESSSNQSTKRAAQQPMLFQTICQPKGEYLAFPRVSSQRRRYIPIAFLDEKSICGDKLIIIPDANMYVFGILMSNVHNAWMRVVAGRLKSDFSYSSGVYNNFPWPNPTSQQRDKIEQTAKEIVDARMLYPNSSLADLYDDLIMPPELRLAHQNNDRAVMQAYGFSVKDMTESSCVAELMKMYQKMTENG